MTLIIGQLSVATGVKIPTIRYYEQIGLLPEGERDKGNRRRYDDEAAKRLLFIRSLRGQGFGVEAIRDLLHVMALPASQSAEAARIARSQLVAVQQKLTGLEQMRDILTDALDGDHSGPATARRAVQLAHKGGGLHETRGDSRHGNAREQPS